MDNNKLKNIIKGYKITHQGNQKTKSTGFMNRVNQCYQNMAYLKKGDANPTGKQVVRPDHSGARFAPPCTVYRHIHLQYF